MQLSKELNDLLIQQVSNEGRNSNVYLQIASWFEAQNLSGFGAFFTKQAEDEIGHKNRILEYLNKRTGANVKMLTVPEINLHINSIKDVGDRYVQLEEQTSEDIKAIIEAALSSGDFMTFQEMQWFIEEQVNEENEANEFKNKAHLIGDNGVGIVLWDSEIGD